MARDKFDDLKPLFQKMRAEDMEHLPDFSDLVRRRLERPSRRRYLARMGAAGAVAAMCAAGVWVAIHNNPGPETTVATITVPASTVQWDKIAEWTAPSDSLLKAGERMMASDTSFASDRLLASSSAPQNKNTETDKGEQL